MPHLELQAYIMALEGAEHLGLLEVDTAVEWTTDCEPAGLAVYKGHSPALEINSLVVKVCLTARRLQLHPEYRWTAGKTNPADEGSRIGRNTITTVPVPVFESEPIHAKLRSLVDDQNLAG